MSKLNYRRIISMILVVCMLILSGATPRESLLGTSIMGLSKNNSLYHISEGECLWTVEDAIVPSVTVHECSANEYRILGRKGNGNISRQLRILQFSFILLCSVFAMPMLFSFYVDFIGEREQKQLIIKYIHDKDGLKSISII